MLPITRKTTPSVSNGQRSVRRNGLSSVRAIILCSASAALFMLGLGFGLVWNLGHERHAQQDPTSWKELRSASTIRQQIATGSSNIVKTIQGNGKRPGERTSPNFNKPALTQPSTHEDDLSSSNQDNTLSSVPDSKSGSSLRGTSSSTDTIETKPIMPEGALLLRGSYGVIVENGVMDSSDLSFSAWIYLDKALQTARKGIKTIASMRDSGCGDGPRHLGWHFFVNEWKTNNRALRLEWGAGLQGCITLSSDADEIEMDQWVHVGFAIQKPDATLKRPGRALLFKNGALLKQAEITERPLQNIVPIHIGITPDAKFPWAGSLAHIIVSKSVISPSQLGHVAAADTVDKFKRVSRDPGMHTDLALICNSVIESCTDIISAKTFRKITTGAVTVPSTDQKSPASPISISGKSTSKYIDNASKAPAPKALDLELAKASLHTPTETSNQWTEEFLNIPRHLVTGSVKNTESLIKGTWDDSSTLATRLKSDQIGRERSIVIRAAMKHTWDGYAKRALGADEIRPRTGQALNNWGGTGMTLIDALDTLYVMGMHEEFAVARNWIAKSLKFEIGHPVSVFETNIRAVGGLISAYELSGDSLFLEKAIELADMLMPAFNTPSGVPKGLINLKTGQISSANWAAGQTILAEAGTLQLEFRHLSWITGDTKYAVAAERVIQVLKANPPATLPKGLYPNFVNPTTGKSTSKQVNFGSFGDSFYEYLLKIWVQGGQEPSENLYREMFDDAMHSMIHHMVKPSSPSGLSYIAGLNNNRPVPKMDHLACFIPGLLALGVKTAGQALSEDDKQLYMQNAKAIMYTCVQMYNRTATGISPEWAHFSSNGPDDFTIDQRTAYYILRPETIESLFILHQLTGHPIYREWGWNIFKAIDKYCKTTYGYGHYNDVRDPNRQPDDRQESFWLAETLKYLYLLQSPDHPITLSKYVLNTEAHPFRRFDQTAEE